VSREKLEEERRCRRQRRWPDICDVYEQVSVSGTGKEVIGFTYQILFSDVKFVLKETPEMDMPTSLGATKEFNILTSDIAAFDFVSPSGEKMNIKSGNVFVLKTPGHLAYGKCWTIEGNAKEVPSSNLQTFYARRGPAPDGVPYDLVEE